MRSTLLLAILVVIWACVAVESKKFKRRVITTTVHRTVPEPPQNVRPGFSFEKPLKPLTEYDKCKLECRRIKDREEMKQYIQHLKNELADVEKQVADAEQAQAAEEEARNEQRQEEAQSEANGENKNEETEQGRITRMAKAAKRMVSNAVHTVTGEKQENVENRL